MKTEKKIKEILDKIRPYLNQDGGNIEFIKYEDGICYVSLFGACAGCEFADITIKDTVEEMIVSEVPEVIRVENIKS